MWVVKYECFYGWMCLPWEMKFETKIHERVSKLQIMRKDEREPFKMVVQRRCITEQIRNKNDRARDTWKEGEKY